MTTLYEKVGRRYKPVCDTNAWDGLSNGTWLVVVGSGMRSAVRVPEGITDAEAALQVALKKFGDCLLDELATANALRAPSSKEPLTKREQKAYKAFLDTLGKMPVGSILFERPSVQEVVERAIQAFAKKVGLK